jgi:hypothetical protein
VERSVRAILDWCARSGTIVFLPDIEESDSDGQSRWRMDGIVKVGYILARQGGRS